MISNFFGLFIFLSLVSLGSQILARPFQKVQSTFLNSPLFAFLPSYELVGARTRACERKLGLLMGVQQVKTAKTGLGQPLFNENVCWRLITHVNSQGRVQIAKLARNACYLLKIRKNLRKRILTSKNGQKRVLSVIKMWWGSKTSSIVRQRVLVAGNESGNTKNSKNSQKQAFMLLMGASVSSVGLSQFWWLKKCGWLLWLCWFCMSQLLWATRAMTWTVGLGFRKEQLRQLKRKEQNRSVVTRWSRPICLGNQRMGTQVEGLGVASSKQLVAQGKPRCDW